MSLSKRWIRGILIAAAAFTLVIFRPGYLGAWNNTEMRWKKIETDHFSIHFHEGEEWSARETARIAEEIYGPITSFYGYPIDRVHITLYDRNDSPSGAAYYYLNRIDIDASDFEFHLRGTSDWLRNVITHEFTHMVTIRTAMKLPRLIPSIYLQGITFEKEKRPDVITGYPNFQGSLPIAGEVLPNWFAEGVAQFQCPGTRSDIWDSHRDMILRTASLNDRLLTLDEMGVFGKNSLESELVYNQGYSLVRFIDDRFGRESLCRILAAHKGLFRVGFEGACRKALGMSGDELYSMWSGHIRAEYEKADSMISEKGRSGEKAAGLGYMNLFPVPGGKESLFFLSNMGGDYMDLDLVRQDGAGDPVVISRDVDSRVSLSPDSRFLCYSKRTGDNEHGYELNDIFIMDAAAQKERRLTRALRAVDPAYSPDGSAIACIRVADGAEDVMIVGVESGEARTLVGGAKRTRYFGLSWGEGGILSSKFDGTSRDIVLIDPVTGAERKLVSTAADERDPCWNGDAEFLYSSDRTGIFNLYLGNVANQEGLMVTNVQGGAFSPAVSGDEILFASYGRGGYEIRRIREWRNGSFDAAAFPDDPGLMERRTGLAAWNPHAAAVDEYDYTALDSRMRSAGNFDIEYTPVFFFPRLMYYDDQLRLGLALDSRDYMDRQSVFAAGSINADKEFNLQFGFETRQFPPTFSFNFVSARKYYRYFEEETGDVQVRYDLWDAYFTCRIEIDKPSRNHRKDLAIRYNHGEYGLNINAWESADQELGWNYYKANEVSILFDFMDRKKTVDSDINPLSGRSINLEITRAWDKLSSGAFEYNFRPIYDTNDFGRYYLSYEEYVPVPFTSHTLSLLARGGLLDETNVDDFFNLYLGGRDGMRGYSYYSMGGKKNAMARLTYRFPIFSGINRQVLSTYFGSLHGAFFIEAGKAWDENEFDLNGNAKDAGFELRLKGFSFYNYPLAASFEAAYGFDELEFRDPFRTGVTTVEGREWKFYGALFFDF